MQKYLVISNALRVVIRFQTENILVFSLAQSILDIISKIYARSEFNLATLLLRKKNPTLRRVT